MEKKSKELRVPPKAKRHRWIRTARVTRPGAGATRNERDIRAGTEDAEYRSGSDTKKGERLLLRTFFVKMTFLTDVMKMGYSEDEIYAVLHESEPDRKRRRVLAKVTETVATYRLREMKDLQARKKLAN